MTANEHFLAQFTEWAHAQTDIRSAFIIGSFGRQTQVAWSDIDIAFVTRKPDRYQNIAAGFSALGQVWASVYDPNDPIMGLPTSATAFCVFENGVYVDFAILPHMKTKIWSELLCNPFTRNRLLKQAASETAYLLQGGVKILFDHDGLVTKLIEALKDMPIEMRQKPAAHEFQALQDDFYLGILHMVRNLMKGQTFAAQIIRDRAIRRALLMMAQWEAQAPQGDWNQPLKYREKEIEIWGNVQFVSKMPVLFNSYGAENLWLSLRTSLEIFSTLNRNASLALEYSVDLTRIVQMEQWIEEKYQQWQKDHTR